jgi:4-amino-4-deoxy-L-arabinose transferase-like glycosyltransferase
VEKIQNTIQPRLFLGLLALYTVIRLITLNAYPLLDPTEGRYAEIPRAMMVADDWVVPRLDGDTPFWGKPPLQFWMIILAYKIFGLSEFSARLPSFLFSILTVVFTFLMAHRLWGQRIGLLTALVLTTSGLFFFYAGNVATDTSLLAMITIALVSFIFAIIDHPKQSARIWGYLFFIGLGLSLLAKGLEGPVIILTPILLWCVRRKQRRWALAALPWKSGVLLSLAISVPWHIWCEIRSPGFLKYYIVGEHFKRFLIGGWEGDLYGNPHGHLPGMIWVFFLTASLPWIGIVAARAYDEGQTRLRFKFFVADPYRSLLLLWLLIPLVFFTFSRNIMLAYALPCLPPFAVLTAKALVSTRARSARTKFPWLLAPQTAPLLSLLTPLIVLIISLAILPATGKHKSQKEVAAAFLRLDVDGGAKLVYLGHMYWSGDFYTRGRASAIQRGDNEGLRRDLADSVHDYFMFRPADLPYLPDELLLRTEAVATFGHLVMRREPDSGDLSPEVLHQKL